MESLARMMEKKLVKKMLQKFIFNPIGQLVDKMDEEEEEIDLKNLVDLPLTRVKKIMKSNSFSFKKRRH
jgi:hypothetical protein